MRKQIAAANWKMNLTYQQGAELLKTILSADISLNENQIALFAVPFPYLELANDTVHHKKNYYAAAQNCSDKKSGAYTGEISAEMLKSLEVPYCLVGHSERREYFGETNEILSGKVAICLTYGLTPVFCCGEALKIRDQNAQNSFVEQQLRESLFHLSAEQILNVVIAYEPIWAIGTGKTASTAQAQEMHAFIRSVLQKQFGKEVAGQISILYGGSVKANNAKELFACPDVDGGLVGGASLVASDFMEIIRALK
ncbi:MAG: triose-phosphate isomerase [Bacteroidota bacterium]|nr:triose-phosphate isomerase [Bacteroidota bacterium]